MDKRCKCARKESGFYAPLLQHAASRSISTRTSSAKVDRHAQWVINIRAIVRRSLPANLSTKVISRPRYLAKRNRTIHFSWGSMSAKLKSRISPLIFLARQTCANYLGRETTLKLKWPQLNESERRGTAGGISDESFLPRGKRTSRCNCCFYLITVGERCVRRVLCIAKFILDDLLFAEAESSLSLCNFTRRVNTDKGLEILIHGDNVVVKITIELCYGGIDSFIS